MRQVGQFPRITVQICLYWIPQRSDGEINGRNGGRRTKIQYMLDFINGQVHKVINFGAPIPSLNKLLN